MPLRALRPCKQLGCLQLTRDASGKCTDHLHTPNEYDKRRGSARQRGYTTQWEKLRMIFLKRNPLCRDCLEEGRTEPANEVHHLRKIKTNPELRLIESNLMSLCKSHHNKRTAKGE